jgi:hypothetical protein
MFSMTACLYIYPIVIGPSCYCVVCLYYECLLSWTGAVVYNVYGYCLWSIGQYSSLTDSGHGV